VFRYILPISEGKARIRPLNVVKCACWNSNRKILFFPPIIAMLRLKSQLLVTLDNIRPMDKALDKISYFEEGWAKRSSRRGLINLRNFKSN